HPRVAVALALPRRRRGDQCVRDAQRRHVRARGIDGPDRLRPAARAPRPGRLPLEEREVRVARRGRRRLRPVIRIEYTVTAARGDEQERCNVSAADSHLILPSEVARFDCNPVEPPAIRDEKSPGLASGASAPATGLEPVTRWLTVTCSTN